MNGLKRKGHNRSIRSTLATTLALGAASALVVVGFAFISASPASATGTAANAITASKAPAAGSVGGSYTPSASATSGDRVVITLDHTSTGCSISGDRVSFTKSGTCLVDFNDSGNATYAPASQVQQSIKVYSANTITASTPPAAGSVGGSYTPSASVTSGDQVVITLDGTSTGCSISRGEVSFTKAGTCRVDFNDTGNVAFAAAIQVQQSIKVYSANTITVSQAPATGSVGGSYTPKASATSGDRVVITLDHTSTGCSISGGKVSFTGGGTCRVDFNDSGNGAFAAAIQVQQSIIVGKKQSALTLTSTVGVYGSNLTLTSSGGSGTGAVSYAVTSAGTAGCSISAGMLSATSAGTCTVTVTKAADTNYRAASSPVTTVTFAKAIQAALTLTSTSGTYGSSLTLSSRGGSGTGAVSYAVTSAGTAGCSISAGMLSATSAGTCTVTVTKAAGTDYRAASSSATTVTFAHKAPAGPKVSSISGRPALIGKTVTFTIRGARFAGVTVKSSNAHTILRMVRRSATLLRFTVTVSNRQKHTGIARLVISNKYGTAALWYSMKRSR